MSAKLTAEDIRMARQLGHTPEQVLKFKQQRAANQVALSTLSEREIESCHSNGVAPLAYAEHKKQLADAERMLAFLPDHEVVALKASAGGDVIAAAATARLMGRVR